MRRISASLLAASLALAGCGIPAPTDPGPGASCAAGILYIAWTIDSAPPTASTCSGIDHLVVTITSSCGTETIDPVPCALDKFQYDDIDVGNDSVEVTGVDVSGATKLFGSVGSDNVAATAPSSPVQIPLVPAS